MLSSFEGLKRLYENDEYVLRIFNKEIGQHFRKRIVKGEFKDSNGITWYRCFNCKSVKPSFFIAQKVNSNLGECRGCIVSRFQDKKPSYDEKMKSLSFQVGIPGEVYERPLSQKTSLFLLWEEEKCIWIFCKSTFTPIGVLHKDYKVSRHFEIVYEYIASFMKWLEKQEESFHNK